MKVSSHRRSLIFALALGWALLLASCWTAKISTIESIKVWLENGWYDRLVEHYEVHQKQTTPTVLHIEIQNPQKLSILIPLLFNQGAEIIGIAHVFSESDPLVNTLIANDKTNETVLSYTFGQTALSNSGHLGPSLPTPEIVDLRNLMVPFAQHFQGNAERLNTIFLKSGFQEMPLESDGVARRVPLLFRYQDAVYPSFTLAMLKAYLANDATELITETLYGVQTLSGIKVGPIFLPTNSAGRILLPLHGDADIQRTTDLKILSGQFQRKNIRDKIIILEYSTDPSILTTREDLITPGVLAARSINAILNGEILAEPVWAKAIIFSGFFILGLIIAFSVSYLRFLPVLIVNVGILATILGTAWIFFYQKGLYLPVGLLSMLPLGVGTIHILCAVWSKYRALKRIYEGIGQRVPEKRIRWLAAHPEQWSLSAQNTSITFFTLTVLDYPRLEAELEPFELKMYLKQLLDIVLAIVYEWGGTLEGFDGRSCRIYFGAPLKDPAHAMHALEAALEILATIEMFNAVSVSAKWPAVRISIGLASGDNLVGDLESKYCHHYFALGTLSLLSMFLSELAQVYGVSLAVSEGFIREMPDMLFRRMDETHHPVLGVIQIFEPNGTLKSASDALHAKLALHDAALTLYLNRAYVRAYNLFSELLKNHPEDAIAEYFIKKINSLSPSERKDSQSRSL